MSAQQRELLLLTSSGKRATPQRLVAATRDAIGVAAMRGFNESLDAGTAYLQAVIDTPTHAPTFVELPNEWWPDSWFADGAPRQIPKYDRPHCRLLRALYGHPEAGALWEATFDEIMNKLGWFSVTFGQQQICKTVNLN